MAASVGAGRVLGLLVVAFGVTVVVTRLFLMLSGYPQVGGGTYHLAHALWGGLLLIVGSILPLFAEGATKDEVAGVVGVSVSTLYRRLGSGVSRVGK